MKGIRVPSVILSCVSDKADVLQKRVQGRHEAMNARLKSFKILEGMYRNDPTHHGYFFGLSLFLFSCPSKMWTHFWSQLQRTFDGLSFKSVALYL